MTDPRSQSSVSSRNFHAWNMFPVRGLMRCLSRLWPARRPLSSGQRGEAAAARYLQQNGLKILARNHRNRLGEIDLIAVEGQTIVFVEVRSRSDTAHGLPAETIDLKKQRRLTRAAIFFLKTRRLLERPARFDVITIVWHGADGQEQLSHFRNAFPATE